MEKYKNRSGKSNVESFKIEAESIHVVFKNGAVRNYVYSYKKPGKDKVEHLKKLAKEGMGLNSYISSVIRDDFEKKF